MDYTILVAVAAACHDCRCCAELGHFFFVLTFFSRVVASLALYHSNGGGGGWHAGSKHATRHGKNNRIIFDYRCYVYIDVFYLSRVLVAFAASRKAT
jgi:hypothetical protein